MQNLVMEGDTLKNYIPFDASFVYTGCEQYIRVVEKVKVSLDSTDTLRTFVFDPNFSIIEQSKSEQCLNYQEQLQRKQEQRCKGQIQLVIDEQKGQIIKHYLKYPSNDLIIGRTGWGRCFNSIKISSDAISRDHCRLEFQSRLHHIKLKGKQRMHDELTTLSILKALSRPSSLLRQLPTQMIKLINSFIASDGRYVLVDSGSRNGTFIQRISPSPIQIVMDYGYQFQGEEYICKAIQMFTDDPKESISDHNQKVKETIDRFRGKSQMTFYQKLKVVIIPDQPNYTQHKLALIALLIDFVSYRKYFLIATPLKSDAHESYPIGLGQVIDTCRFTAEFGQVNLHGRVKYDGKWWIQGYGKGIWQRLPPRKEHPLQTTESHRIRLGHLNIFELDFYNVE